LTKDSTYSRETLKRTASIKEQMKEIPNADKKHNINAHSTELITNQRSKELNPASPGTF